MFVLIHNLDVLSLRSLTEELSDQPGLPEMKYFPLALKENCINRTRSLTQLIQSSLTVASKACGVVGACDGHVVSDCGSCPVY